MDTTGNYLSDLTTRAEQSAANAGNNIYDWLDSQASDAVIKVGDKALGNQTAADIANGQAGGPGALKPGSGNPASLNAAPYPTTMKIAGVSVPLLLAVGAVAYYLLKRH